MGWSGGSTVVENLADVFLRNIEDPKLRLKLYLELLPSFEDEDWDTQDEVRGIDPALDEAIKTMHPDWNWE